MISPKPDSALKLYQRQLMQQLKHKRTSLVAALLTILLHIMLLQATAIPNWHSMPVPRIEQVVQISLSPSTLLEDRPSPLIGPSAEPKKQESKPKPTPRQPNIAEPKVETNSEEFQQPIPDAPANDFPPGAAEPPAKPRPEPEPSPAVASIDTLALPESVELKMALLLTLIQVFGLAKLLKKLRF